MSSQSASSQLRSLVHDVPVGITVLRGPNFIVEMANNMYLQIVDRKEEDFVGRPLFEGLPEVREAVEPLLNDVYYKGVPYYGHEFPAPLNRYGKREIAYFNFVYQPTYDEGKSINGIVVVANEVTANVLSKQKVAESEKKFREIVMRSHIAMTIFLGEDFVIDIANQKLLDTIWRTTSDKVIGKKLLDVFPELNDQKFPELLRKVYREGIPHTEQEAIVYVGGFAEMQKFYVDFAYEPLFDADHKVFGLIVTVTDVTERVEYRKKLEEAEEKSRLAIESANLGTYEIEIATDDVVLSKRFLNIFGYGHLVNRDEIASRIHPDDLKLRTLAHETALVTGHLSYEVRLILPGDNLRWILAEGTVLRNKEGKPLTLIGVVKDITEEKLFSQKLTEAEEKSRLAIDSAHLGTYELDLATDVLINSSRLLEIFGVRNASHIDIVAAVHPDDLEIRNAAQAEALKTGHLHYEVRIIRPDKKLTWIRAAGTILRNKEGQPTTLIGIVQDITEEKSFSDKLELEVQYRTEELQAANEEIAATNEELAESNSMLINANFELEQFNYAASHDLQEPVRKIQTFASYLITEGINADKAKNIEFLKKIISASDRMKNIIDDLLLYARHSRTEKQLVSTDLNAILEAVCSDLDLMIEQKNAKVEIGELPTIQAIPGQMHQLFRNLMSNSLKFVTTGVAPVIKIEVIDQDLKNVHIIFEDNGIGFAQEFADYVFKLFKRLHSRSEYDGTGIGLSLCKKIVENHGGDIYAESQPGRGTAMHIILPLL